MRKELKPSKESFKIGAKAGQIRTNCAAYFASKAFLS